MEGPGDADSPRHWTALTLACAAALLLLGGGIGTFRGPAAIDLASVRIPETIEPRAEATYPSPPTTFRWRPGTGDALAQIMIFQGNFETLWTSAPLRGVGELTVPLEAYEGQPAGPQLLWRVREVRRGQPLGSSGYTAFSFSTDWKGYRGGEAPVVYDVVEQ